ncbi:glucose-6-phosphate dehydrogenase [Burkholderia guangdongensis]|uniref:glucose-6-phosphate dehydrogenase n=1 Tax=Burkholderia guangdongensis TaxID=1792500 RepID=UPI0015CEE72E|nr:glucose-6-phosphate dehydrogenase [Burkholderia guangdongensis]
MPATDHHAPALPVDLVIFGGAGDLTIRKLLPALYMAWLHGSLPANIRIIATGKQAWSLDDYRAYVECNVRPFIDARALQDDVWARFLARFDYVRIDATCADDYRALADLARHPAQRIFYLATSASLFTTICESLASVRLVDEHARIVLEKPLGHDLASARAISDDVAKYFSEAQTYRIDHYLGKETVQNLMVLRFGNPIFQPIWQAPSIRSVQITVAETVGVESRAGFYDHTGALRDMIQNHLLQLLCIVAMEPPVSLHPDDVRDEKLKVLRSLHRMSVDDVARYTVRGQYARAESDEAEIGPYSAEQGVAHGSLTETFVAVRAQVNNWRWSGVPFYLRSGKRMHKRTSQIVIDFAEAPFSIMPRDTGVSANRLIITLQPEESIRLQILAKEPGSGMRSLPVDLDLDLAQAFTERRAEAYERLLIDVIQGRLTHFMRRDELEAAWAWTDAIQSGWAAIDQAPQLYPAGTAGPPASDAMLARDGLSWFDVDGTK